MNFIYKTYFQYLNGVFGGHGQTVPHHVAEVHREEQDHVITQEQQMMDFMYIAHKLIQNSKMKKQENVCWLEHSHIAHVCSQC